MKAKNRKNPGKDARIFAMWYRKKRTKDTLEKIGTYYSNRDHATVLHAVKTTNNLMETDKIFRAKCEGAIKVLDKLKIS